MMNQIYHLRDMSYNSYSYSEFYSIEEKRWFIASNVGTHKHIVRISNQTQTNQALLLISLGLSKTEIEDQLGTSNENHMANSS